MICEICGQDNARSWHLIQVGNDAYENLCEACFDLTDRMNAAELRHYKTSCAGFNFANGHQSFTVERGGFLGRAKYHVVAIVNEHGGQIGVRRHTPKHGWGYEWLTAYEIGLWLEKGKIS